MTIHFVCHAVKSRPNSLHPGHQPSGTVVDIWNICGRERSEYVSHVLIPNQSLLLQICANHMSTKTFILSYIYIHILSIVFYSSLSMLAGFLVPR